ncbi:hypothetical protein ABIB99_007395 [Bradyrhizobium sp. LA6.1]|uniref:hypothetical protein n=1 Tax=Bradyrhizobium sp. LA6.1 TaxID=3156378 RepID=UPI0033962ADF
MAKPAVSRHDFRGLFAFYAAKARHDHRQQGEYLLARLFATSDNISDGLLDLWSERVAKLDPEMVGDVLCPRAREVAEGRTAYDHASDFLHALLRDLEQKQH